MLGLSTGQLLVILGACSIMMKPRDLIKIARVAGRMSGRAVGHLMLFRRQMDDILEQTAARKVNKELRDAMTQLDSIRHEVQNLSRLTPSQIVMKHHSTAAMADAGTDDAINGSITKEEDSCHEIRSMIRDEIENYCRRNPELFSRKLDSPDPIQNSCNPHSQALLGGRLTRAPRISGECGEQFEESNEHSNVLPISAESAGLLPKRSDAPRGSDLVLEAVIEADVAELAVKAKHKIVTNPHDQLHE